MKCSNTTIKELTAQYRAVLKKCAILNAAVLMGAFVAMPAVAADLTQRIVVDPSENLTLTDPSAKDLTATEDGAVILNEGGLNVSNGTFENNETTKNGGVIVVNSKTGADTVIDNSKFVNNKADAVNGDSGALSIQNGSLTITGSTFEGNSAGLGGALYAYTGNNHYVKVKIKDSVFKNNVGSTTTAADEAGGAIVNVANGYRNNGDAGMWIDNTTFEGNKAVGTNAGGGALFAGSTARTNLTNSKFIGNSSETVGGAIATRISQNASGSKNNNSGFLDIIGTTFEGNTAAQTGGALDNYFHNSDTKEGTVWVSKSAFNNNSAENGGAIYNHGDKDNNGIGGVMTIADTTFDGNKANSHGGAIYNNGTMTISNGTFTNNEAKRGGAMLIQGVTSTTSEDDMTVTTISNSLFKNNKATGDIGGAIAVGKNAKAIIKNSVFDSNSAVWSGAIYTYAPMTGSTGGYIEIDGSRFVNNTATENGAAGFFSKTQITNSVFDSNTATSTAADTEGAGAIFFGAESKSTLNNVAFTNNTSAAQGGAISTRATTLANNQKATLDIANSQFDSNKAATNGGAIFNTFYNSNTTSGAVSIVGTSFTNNEAKNGGAIYNNGTGDKGGNIASIAVSNSVFANNHVSVGDYQSGASGTYKREGVGGAIANSGKLTVDNSVFTGNTALTTSNGYGLGGAISNITIDGQKADLTVKNSTFTGNKAEVGGAIYSMLNDNGSTTLDQSDVVIENSLFQANEAGSGSAIANFDNVTIKDSTFRGNKANKADEDGGALFAGSQSTTRITGGLFEGNTSLAVGGAIATRFSKGDGTGPKHTNAGMTIDGTTFASNHSDKDGGAIFNTFYKDADGNQGVLIKDATFTGNTANGLGGAIYNESKVDGSNTRAEITFKGTTTFTGNTANGVKNDIYNGGIINIADGATVNFDGGIDADTTTAGSVLNIGDGSTIGLTLTSATDYTKIKSYEINYSGTSKLALTIATAGTYDVFDAEYFNYLSGSTPQPELTSNALYDLEAVMGQDNGTDYFTGTIVAKAKSTTQIAADTGVDQEAANALGALAQSDSVLSNQIALAAQQQLAAGNAAGVQKEVEKLNPQTAPTVQTVAQNNHEQVLGAVANRLAGFGRNGGDVNVDYGMWAQGLYNKTKLDGEFNGYTQGVAIGFDGLINDVYTVGLGYAYSNSNIKPTGRKLDVDGNTFLVYGQYKPNKFYVNGALSYARTNYKEKTNVYGVALDNKFDVDTYGVNAVAGYDLPYGMTPEAGVRYTYVDDYKYNNGVSEVKVKSNDVLTGLAGFKYSVSATENGLTFAPEVKAYATYDVLSDGNSSVVSIANAAPYSVAGKRLSRFGGEFGLGFKSSYKGVDLTLSYDLSVRRDFTSQTGSLKLKYNF